MRHGAVVSALSVRSRRQREWVVGISEAVSRGVLTAQLTAGGSDVLRRPETKKGLKSGLTRQVRRDQTGKNAVPLSPQPQDAGSIPVPPAPSREFMGLADLCYQHYECALTSI
jgi:hypothetical protein